MKTKMYVLHSPYPDKTWRGIGSCLGNPEYDAIYFFQDIQAAKDYIRREDIEEGNYSIVEIEVDLPAIEDLEKSAEEQLAFWSIK
jgi:hypothetical protein